TAVQQMFQLQHIPQVVIAYSANYAYAALLEMQRCGLRPGKDVHLLAFTSLEADTLALMPDATVVAIDEQEVGRRAYQLLHEKMMSESPPQPPQTVRVIAKFRNHLLR